MIIDEIKKAKVEAMKEHNESKKTAYSMAVNKYMLASIELKAQGKEFVDADMVQVLQKLLKELAEEKEFYVKANREESVADLEIQISALQEFLPKMMSKDEIKLEIDKLADKNIGSVMKHFKINFAGKCDMRDVQEVLKNINN